MSLTVYNDVILPASVIAAAGLQGRQQRNNSRTVAQGGQKRVNINWARTLRQYDLGFIPMLPATWQTIEGIFEVTEAGAYGFLLEDPKDCSATVATGQASLVSGTNYQLYKRYTSVGSTRTKDRNITRPIATGFAIYTSGTPIGSYTLNADTGVIAIPAGPSAATLTWSGRFYTPVHFASDEIDWELMRSGGADQRLIAGRSISQPLMDVGCRDHGSGHHMLSATGAAGKITLATEVSGATLSERSVLDATFAKTGAAT